MNSPLDRFTAGKPAFLVAFVFLLAAAPGWSGERSGIPIKAPPAGSQWTMTIERKAAPSSSPPGEVLPVQLRKFLGKNGVQNAVITFSDSSTVEYFVVNGRILQKPANSRQVVILGRSRSDVFSLVVPEFPGLDWIKAEHRVGQDKVGDVLCEKFHADGFPPQGLPKDFALTAWISAVDGYPDQVILGETTYRFSPVTPFDQDIDLPGGYQAALKAAQRQTRALSKLKALNEPADSKK